MYLNISRGSFQKFVSFSETFDLEECLAYLKIRRLDTFKKQRWEQINKLAVRSVLRSWEEIIWKDIWKNMLIFLQKTLNNYAKILSQVKMKHQYTGKNLKRKLELGRAIYEFIHENEIYQQSLRSEYKETLDLYMN